MRKRYKPSYLLKNNEEGIQNLLSFQKIKKIRGRDTNSRQKIKNIRERDKKTSYLFKKRENKKKGFFLTSKRKEKKERTKK